jgi:hypothetical protein
MFLCMQNRLRPYSKETLLGPLKAMCESNGIRLPGRLCHRNKKALVCFFCEYFPDFPKGFPPSFNSANWDVPKPATPDDHAKAHEPVSAAPPVPPLGSGSMEKDSPPRKPNNFSWEWSSGSSYYSLSSLNDSFFDD